MSRYLPKRVTDVARLIREEVMGIVTSCDADGYIATPLPLLAVTDDQGAVTGVVGHFGRANPHVDRIARTPRALVTFMGPHGYIPTPAISKPRWAPTWNYQFVQLEVEVTLHEFGAKPAIEALSDVLEGTAPTSWKPADLGDRYDALANHVVGFSAVVLKESPRFKLGQDEDRTTFNEIIRYLNENRLAAAMLDQS